MINCILLRFDYIPYRVTERTVEIPVPKKIRDEIKIRKGVLTYAEYFKSLMVDTNDFTLTSLEQEFKN